MAPKGALPRKGALPPAVALPPEVALPPGVATELGRLVQRWRQLPLDQALSRMPPVQALLERLAVLACKRSGPDQAMCASRSDGSVELTVLGPPDLGPAVVMDQLTVLVYDVATQSAALHPGNEDFARVKVVTSPTAQPTGLATTFPTAHPTRPATALPATPATTCAGAIDVAEELASVRRGLG